MYNPQLETFLRVADAGSADVHDGLFTRPSDTQVIKEYLEQNGLTK